MMAWIWIHTRACAYAAMVLFLVGCAGAAEVESTAEPDTVGPDFARPEKLTIGYLPNLYMIQFAAADDQGWLREELGTEIELHRFPTGTPMLQAMAGGEIDVGYIGIGPTITAAHQGLPVKAVAVNSRDAYVVVTTTSFAGIFAQDPSAAAFGTFEQQEGRKLRIGTFPRGTTLDVFLRYWLTTLGVDHEQDLEIIPMDGNQMATALAAGSVDGILAGEPTISRVLEGDPEGYEVIMWSGDVVPNLIATVVLVQESLIEEYPELVQKLVEIHVRATKLWIDDKEYWAELASELIGPDILPLELAQQAVQAQSSNLTNDLRGVAPSILVYDQFLVDDGVWPEVLPVEAFFDFRFFDRVAADHPELLE